MHQIVWMFWECFCRCRDADVGIPVNVTVNATLASVSDDVYVKYNTFTPDATSVKNQFG